MNSSKPAGVVFVFGFFPFWGLKISCGKIWRNIKNSFLAQSRCNFAWLRTTTANSAAKSSVLEKITFLNILLYAMSKSFCNSPKKFQREKKLVRHIPPPPRGSHCFLSVWLTCSESLCSESFHFFCLVEKSWNWEGWKTLNMKRSNKISNETCKLK